MAHITVKPAYGRVYTNKAQVQAAFDENRDFVITDEGADFGKKISRSQLPAGTLLQIRYGKPRPDGIGPKVMILP